MSRNSTFQVSQINGDLRVCNCANWMDSLIGLYIIHLQRRGDCSKLIISSNQQDDLQRFKNKVACGLRLQGKTPNKKGAGRPLNSNLEFNFQIEGNVIFCLVEEFLSIVQFRRG
ncbi:unnamed protein product [Lepeophtheirus salmonis]|uniref:(salmon louse) hypothetical protein n=1 Tax=Lepeophtheirus salmonis TaxID=72036 RepID=A0A7R8CAI0_LEPSM|nr:unnamed protein product [Lepeophtheirus salmonis]CAF2751345.1 unnamed protein product [Lepeophtheirus salmonis]